MTAIDSTAAHVLLEIIDDYNERGVRVLLVRLRRALKLIFERAGILKALGRRNLKHSMKSALAALQPTAVGGAS